MRPRVRVDRDSKLRQQRVGVGGYVDRHEAIGDWPRRLQAVAGDEEDDPVVGAHLTPPDRLAERAERHAGRGFAEDTGRFREQCHVLPDLVLGHSVDRAAGLARCRDRRVAVGGTADRERAGDRVGPHRFHGAVLCKRCRDG
jgi:hypothetical protein